MKKLYVLIILSLFINLHGLNAQWVWQNPLPQGNTLDAVSFVNANTGYATGAYGTIMKTTNGGAN
ncbi:MAG TPA: hypothetical protein PK447_08390, partial [Ignavibacteria bacterium]|nr:hypothetical protein [Ignavibacteria bacterium]